jgi:NADH:ubiquinone oxidoreductase subunit 6 (subunit J)
MSIGIALVVIAAICVIGAIVVSLKRNDPDYAVIFLLCAAFCGCGGCLAERPQAMQELRK